MKKMKKKAEYLCSVIVATVGGKSDACKVKYFHAVNHKARNILITRCICPINPLSTQTLTEQVTYTTKPSTKTVACTYRTYHHVSMTTRTMPMLHDSKVMI